MQVPLGRVTLGPVRQGAAPRLSSPGKGRVLVLAASPAPPRVTGRCSVKSPALLMGALDCFKDHIAFIFKKMLLHSAPPPPEYQCNIFGLII